MRLGSTVQCRPQPVVACSYAGKKVMLMTIGKRMLCDSKGHLISSLTTFDHSTGGLNGPAQLLNFMQISIEISKSLNGLER